MIQRLRNKFIAISTAALVIVLITIIGSMVSVSSIHAHRETLLSQHNGQLSTKNANEAAKKRLGSRFNREELFQYRYFSANISKDGKSIKIDNSHILTVSPDAIADLAKTVQQRERTRGIIRYQGTSYAYKMVKKKNGQIGIVFLDQSMIFKNTHDLMLSGIVLGIISLILFEFVLIMSSKRAIKPVIEAEKRQKEFITNAGHELKTPLSIISANTELEEMMNGESEWTQSNKQQVQRLTHLINLMISLAKLDERPELQLQEIDPATEVQKAIDNFKAVIAQSNHQLKYQLQPGLKLKADPNYYYELISILLDNANKYCDPNGTIFVDVSADKHGKNVLLKVGNSYAEGKNVDYNKFFERFYRNDTSHNNEKRSGFGIGLSIAQNLVKNFKGSLSVDWKDGTIYFTASFKSLKQSSRGNATTIIKTQ